MVAGPAPQGLLVEGAAEIATLAGGPRRGSDQADAGVMADPGADLAVLCMEGRIAAVGRGVDVGRRLAVLGLEPEGIRRVDARGGLVTPGLIDPHTHLLFGGTRERELRMRQAGAGYLEILAGGGGILSTVARTREAAHEELLAHGRRWLAEMLRHGVTTVEAKTGYGLDVATELHLLEVLGELDLEGPVEVVPTYLGAHAVPAELRGLPHAADAHVTDVVERQLPRVAEQGIARYCDVFCEKGVFDAAQSRRVLEAALRLGLAIRLHADELHDSGGAALAAELGATSADHLAAISDAGIGALSDAAGSGAAVVATLLPATTFYLMSEHFAPARRLIEAGVPVALGTDFNPGTSPTPNLPLALAVATISLRLSPQEALVAATANAARSVGLGDTHGRLEPGAQADLVVWDVPSVEQLTYWLGADLARVVVKRGRVVAGVAAPADHEGDTGRA